MEITKLDDGTIIEMGPGKFDDYCVYVTPPKGKKYAPRDTEYFSFFIEKTPKYTAEKIYNDYVKIYDKTTAFINQDVISEIKNDTSQSYTAEDVRPFILWYIVIYLGMVAEENKKNAILKKRIKRLGMYQILFDGLSASQAAFFSKGRKATELSELCESKGF